MSVAFDFSRVPGPTADEIKANGGEGALTYGTGAEQPADYLASLDAAGLHHPLIWEHNTDSILGGYDYGVAECKAWEASHPSGLVYLACDLNDGALGGRSVVPFCNGWCDTTREETAGLYGADKAILDGMAMNRPKLSRWWGVVNWIDGGGPNNDPANIAYWQNLGAHLVQLIGSPIDGTDQNLILKPDWWTTGATTKEIDVQSYSYFATSPWDLTQLQVWWIGEGTHRYVDADEWATIKFNETIAGRPAPKVNKGTPSMFNNTRDLNTIGSGGSSGPLALSGTFTGKAA